jgi:opacity protein-like surface antigen
MNTRSLRAACAAMSVLFVGAGVACAADLPPVQHDGSTTYLSGGIGQDESSAMKSIEKQWPLSMEFAENHGGHADYVAGVDVVVRDASGRTALQATTDGPFMMAQLPPGRYTIEASLDGNTKRESVTIKGGAPAHATFVWPAGADDSAV